MDNDGLHRYLRDKGADDTAIKTCVNIMQHWGLTRTEVAVVLGVSTFSLSRYLASPQAVRLSRDQRDRTSYILNIHAALSTLFSNPDNTFGFVSIPNRNDFFDGRKPKLLLVEGGMESLILFSRHL